MWDDAMHARGERRKTIPEDVLTISAHLFRRHGFAGTSTRDIATAVGLQKASLYHYVDGKDDILLAICTRSLDRITAAIEQVRDHVGLAPAQRMHAMITSHVQTLLEDADLHATMLREIPSLAPAGRRQVIEQREAYQQMILEIVKQAQEAGVVSADDDPSVFTLTLLGAMNWSVFWYSPSGGLSTAELGDAMARAFCINGSKGGAKS